MNPFKVRLLASSLLQWMGSAFFVLCVSAAVLVTQTTDVFAQGRDNRARLNIKAVELADEGKYDEAVDLLSKALDLGELNVTYLNLGRVYQRSGLCEEALDAYKKALTAPSVPKPPENVVRSTAQNFIEELEMTCPGTAIVRCSPPDLVLTIEGQTYPCGAPFEMVPGEHKAVGTKNDRSIEVNITIRAMESSEVTLAFPPPQSTTGKVTVVCVDDDVQITVAGQQPTACPAELELPTGTHTLTARREGFEPHQMQVDVGPNAISNAAIPVLVATAGDGLYRAAIRYGTGAAVASGALFQSDNPDTPFDNFPADGTQDETDGLQPGLINHVIELEGSYMLSEQWSVGLLAWVQAPAFGFALGPVGSYKLLQIDKLEIRLRGYSAVGQLVQRMESEGEAFIAKVGPVVLGGGGQASYPLSESLSFVGGLHLQAGVPDLAILMNLTGGVEFQF